MSPYFPRLRTRCWMVLLAMPATPVSLASQESTPVPVDSMLAMRSVRWDVPIAVTPDGRWAAATVDDPRHNTAEAELAGQGDTFRHFNSARITLTDLDSGAIRRVSPAGYAAWGPSWSPDGRRLAFFADSGGETRAWTWSWEAGAAPIRTPPVTAAQTGTFLWAAPVWANDSTVILSLAPEVGGDRSETDFAGREPTGAVVYRTGFPAARHPSAPRPGNPPRLVRVHIESGRMTEVARGETSNPTPAAAAGAVAFEVLTDGTSRAIVVVIQGGASDTIALEGDLASNQLVWSPDASLLAVRRSNGTTDRLDLVYLRGPAVRVQTVDALPPLAMAPMVWGPGGTALYVLASGDLWQVEAATGSGRKVFEFADGVTPAAILAGGSSTSGRSPEWTEELTLLVRERDAGREGFLRLNLRTFSVTAETWMDRQIGGLTGFAGVATAREEERIVFVSEASSEPPDLGHVDGALARAVRLGALNPQLEGYDFVGRRIVRWDDSDGRARRGLLLLPAEAAVRPVPLIVWLYFRSEERANVFGLTGNAVMNGQTYATRGYAVFFPSIEWEREHAMRGLANQVLPGLDSLVNSGLVDSTRIGLMGHSSGAFDVMALMVQSERFRAAVVVSGWGSVDLFSMYTASLTSSAPAFWVRSQIGVGAAPWENPDRFIRNSPGYSLDRVAAPVLIAQGVVGDSPGRTQSDLLYAGLRLLGKPAEYRRYEREGHVPDRWSAVNRRDLSMRILAWFGEHLGSPGKEGGGLWGSGGMP